MRTRTRALLALLAAGALALAACGAAPAAGTGTVSIGSVNPYGGDPATEGTPERGGVLRMGMDRAVVSFDPAVQNTNPAMFAVYDSLLRLRPDGTVEPHLARSMDSPDGGTTWRIGLRPDVLFSDGNLLDADAVLVNLQRHRDRPASAGHTYAQRIASMRAADPLTVEIVLDRPIASFPVVFAYSTTYGSLGVIASPTALARYGDDIGSHPVGAGPFVLTEWVRDAGLRLERNPHYWQEGLPHLDALEFRPLPDTETRYASIHNGDVDLIFGAYDEELSRALQDPALTVYYGLANGGELAHFNFRRPPFDDRRMREAVIRAIDFDALGAVQYGGNRVPATSIFTDASPYHDPRSTQAWPGHDREAARRLVEDYRASGGDPDFQFKTVATWLSMAEFVQAQMAEVGIGVDIEVHDLAQYASQVVQSGDFDLATNLVTFETPYPFVGRFTHSQAVGNFGHYANPEVDVLIDRASSTVDAAGQVAAYQGVERITNEDLAFLWLSRGFLSTITRTEVKGVSRYLDRAQFYDRLWLDR